MMRCTNGRIYFTFTLLLKSLQCCNDDAAAAAAIQGMIMSEQDIDAFVMLLPLSNPKLIFCTKTRLDYQLFMFSSVINVFMSLLAMCQLFDEKLLPAASATKKPLTDKRKKELFKQLVQDAIGVSYT